MFETPGVEMITGGILKASLGHFRTCHIKTVIKVTLPTLGGEGAAPVHFLAQIYVFVKPCIYQFIR